MTKYEYETLNDAQIDALIDEFIENEVDEDRLEYSIDDFVTSHIIDEKSARALQRRLHERAGLLSIYNAF